MPDKGIYNKIFRKKTKPVSAQRVVLSDTQKQKDITEKNAGFEAIDFCDLYEETGLEETPPADFTLERPKKCEKDAPKQSPESKKEEPPRSDIAQAGYRTQRKSGNKKGIFAAARSMVSLFSGKPKTSNSAALEFAESGKRLSKKSKRNRRILVYSGTGLLVVTILMFVVLVPGGAAAPAAGATPSPPGSQSGGIAYVAAGDIAIPSETYDDYEEITDYYEDYSLPPEETEGVPDESYVPEPTAVETTEPDVTPPPINVDEVVQGFKVDAERYYNEVGYSSNHYKYTDQELYMLAQVIHAEARGEGTKGMIAVGNVVMNRVLCRSRFPNTIKSVVAAPNQFAYNPGTKPNIAAKIAARQVLDYEVWVIPQNIYYFRVSQSKNNWCGKYEFNIKAHAFYSNSYSGRSRVDSVPPALYKRTFKWPTRGCKPEHRVYRLQWMLNKLGYDVKADKFFGEDTKEAIKQFQKKKGLKVDGLAGPVTLKAVILEFGLREYYLKFGNKK